MNFKYKGKYKLKIIFLSFWVSLVPFGVTHAEENTKSDISILDDSKSELSHIEQDEEPKNKPQSPENFKNDKDEEIISNKNNPFSFILKVLNKMFHNIKNLSPLQHLAHSILFCGRKDDHKYLKKLEKIFEVEEINLKWPQVNNATENSKKDLNLHGYIFKPKSENYDTVCICFGSDMRPCHKMVTSDSYDKILYVCIDYPSFGSSEYMWLDENKMFEFSDLIYNYVSETYKDKKLIAMGFSLGGFGASYMSQKERISEVYLISPVYLPGILGSKFCQYLFGYELSFIKNLENCNHKCKVYIMSGGKIDFLSLYYTLIYYFSDKLSNDKDINSKMNDCISFLKENKNLDIYCEVADEYSHLTIHPYSVKKYSEEFLIENEEKIEKNDLLLAEAS